MSHGVSRNAALWRGFVVSIAALFVLTSPAFAAEEQQSTSPSAHTAQPSAPPPDFFLGKPHASISARASWFMPTAGSDFYEQVTHDLTLEKKDFNSGAFAFEGGWNLTSHVDITFGVDLYRMSQDSEDRDQLELLPNGTRVPIQQNTALRQTNITASAKFLLVPKGHAISRLAWIPNALVPYVGVGGGMSRYSLTQSGDFVDFVDNHIFTDTFQSDGWAPTVHVFVGTDIQMYKRLLLTLEGRYSWSHADLAADFISFEPLDLGGVRFGAGVQFLF